jgi:hypothetical protein
MVPNSGVVRLRNPVVAALPESPRPLRERIKVRDTAAPFTPLSRRHPEPVEGSLSFSYIWRNRISPRRPSGLVEHTPSDYIPRHGEGSPLLRSQSFAGRQMNWEGEMFFAIKAAEALGLGLYSSVVLRSYTILVSRTKSDAIRLLLFLIEIAVGIFIPLVGWAELLDQSSGIAHAWTRNQRMGWLFALFFCWMGPVWVYIISNWRILNQRLRLPKDIDDPSRSKERQSHASPSKHSEKDI